MAVVAITFSDTEKKKPTNCEETQTWVKQPGFSVPHLQNEGLLIKVPSNLAILEVCD